MRSCDWPRLTIIRLGRDRNGRFLRRKRVYITDTKSDADIVIYYTRTKSEAGWQNRSKSSKMD